MIVAQADPKAKNILGIFNCSRPKTNAAFTRGGLTTRYRKESLYKSIFVLSRSHDI